MWSSRQVGSILASAMLLSSCGLLTSEPDVVPPTRPGSAPSAAALPTGTTTPTDAATPAGSSPPAASPSASPVDLSPFYEQKVSWKNCGNADCATVKVPLDYARPEGPTIDLAITRVKATGDKIGSLFVNPGGPGGSAFDYAKAADGIVTSSIREHYDVVGVDPRGVAHSDPVECLSDQQIDDLMAADGTPDSAAEEQIIVDDSKLPAQACAENGGKIVGHMGTVDAARDLDVVRALVKDETFNYLGKSYGTMLGATYAELFPDRVGRMVLDGVLPPGLDLVEVTKGQADAFEVAFVDFVKDCRTHEDCPLDGTTDQAAQQLRDFLTGLDTKPITSGGRDLNEALATYAVLSYLYFPGNDYPALRGALRSAMVNRNAEPMLSLLDARISRGPDGRYLDNSTDAFYAVTCLDRPYAGTVDDVRALAEEWRATAPTFGPPLAWGLLPCADWPASAEAVQTATAKGSNPILILSTRNDPATPYQWGKVLDDQLENATMVTWEGYGHTAYGEGSGCIDDAVDAYLLKGTMPKDGLVCS